ncbi:unnamed protein product [Caenorhabditis sp. 36 PRJEB53466]|nr:unnamed protein product [Caenorhabditis sp. 36 PRJEB53466]
MLGYPLRGVVRDLNRVVFNGWKIASTSICAKRSIGSSDEDAKFVPYNKFDVLLLDMKEKDLFDLGDAFHMKHLALGSFPNFPFPSHGRIHGVHHRLMIPLVCQYPERLNSKPYNVWFIVYPGAPYTYLSVRSLETIVGTGFSHNIHTLSIQDPSVHIECRTSHDHFFDFNLLGMDESNNGKITQLLQNLKMRKDLLVQLNALYKKKYGEDLADVLVRNNSE